MLSRYEKLIVNNKDVEVEDTLALPASFSGFYTDGVAFVDKHLSSTRKLEVLAEEIAHFRLSYGNITDFKNLLCRKFEIRARRSAYEEVLPLDDIIDAFKKGVSSAYELAEKQEVTTPYILECLDSYKQRYGIYKNYKGYRINFESLEITKI